MYRQAGPRGVSTMNGGSWTDISVLLSAANIACAAPATMTSDATQRSRNLIGWGGRAGRSQTEPLARAMALYGADARVNAVSALRQAYGFGHGVNFCL